MAIYDTLVDTRSSFCCGVVGETGKLQGRLSTFLLFSIVKQESCSVDFLSITSVNVLTISSVLASLRKKQD